ncbi:tax1-binding protein 1 homolog B isoform X3 [Denticeps clupeoides]|uniref:tax1-binding protein 1 homolog B isoform X3 n=1 Tax=Denticeps clupeoides TaxID=299321 RepID=UPI0010A2BC3D|nr:tax1-binding protein 1 isoform X3 [Denticeps clupeoides]
MAFFQAGTSAGSAMETSNYAHVIFQNVGKSYLPNAALECHYTLTQFIKPHQKDWVGIFKVGWSTARDYYTFLWSPLPEEYTEGTAINRSVVFQGYYVPNDDGEFYQFCYVTHKGEIRGASTPFQFRANTPTEDELLAVEDENNSDILVVTTKASFLEQKMEELCQEKEEVVKAMELVQKENAQLVEEKERLLKEYEQEHESSTQLRREIQELQGSFQSLQEEREEVKRRQEETTARVLQLEEDLIGVTQKGLQKETELDCLKDRLKKLSLEKEALESQLKNEKDEKELYKIHLKNRELENTKLGAELQMLKAVDVNKENTIAQLKDELTRLKSCLAEKEKQHKEMLANCSPSGESKALKEQLRQVEEKLMETQQQVAMLSAELGDAASARDRSMADMYRLRLETDSLRQGQASAHEECKRLQQELEHVKNTAQQEAFKLEVGLVEELHREVEDLKLRLQMAAEHYKDKYKECQKLQKQVAKLTEQQGEIKRNPEAAAAASLNASPETSAPGSPGNNGNDAVLDAIIQGKLKGIEKESDKNEKYKKIKQMLVKEKERSCIYVDELTKMEVKLKEQLKTNESLKLQLAAEEDRFKGQVAEKGRELKELKDSLAKLQKEKEKLEGKELQRNISRENNKQSGEEEEHSLDVQSVLLQYPLPYTQDAPTPLLVPQRPTDLQYRNPYSTPDAQDEDDVEDFLNEPIARLPPTGPPSWDSNVVCIQPARNLSRPDGLEEPNEQQTNATGPEQPAVSDSHSAFLNDGQMPFCFESSGEQQKRCPLCEVIFPPHYDQSKFEEHVESHWKVCPMCSEQFPLECDQQLFERHVLTHFDGNVLNFD